jgi:predicted GH43/DUF377 family glycosyl hydrolase
MPVLSWTLGTSEFQQVFNPSWVDPACGRSGLLVRAQNCTPAPGECAFCQGPGENASVLVFSEQLPDGNFAPTTADSVVLAPWDDSDAWGTEDPRLQYNPRDSLYYLFYTAFAGGGAIFLSLATSPDPTRPHGWRRHGPVFPALPGSKSGALLLRDPPAPHILLWGDSVIRAAASHDPAAWPDPGPVLLAPRPGRFDSLLVESGPPPLRLSTGDHIFFYNSASDGWPAAPGSGYHPAWAVLDAAGPAPPRVRQRAAAPLLGPARAWERGAAPFTCNAPAVVFLSAAAALGGDRFRVFFGGADAVVGTAVVAFTPPPPPPPGPPGPQAGSWARTAGEEEEEGWLVEVVVGA